MLKQPRKNLSFCLRVCFALPEKNLHPERVCENASHSETKRKRKQAFEIAPEASWKVNILGQFLADLSASLFPPKPVCFCIKQTDRPERNGSGNSSRSKDQQNGKRILRLRAPVNCIQIHRLLLYVRWYISSSSVGQNGRNWFTQRCDPATPVFLSFSASSPPRPDRISYLSPCPHSRRQTYKRRDKKIRGLHWKNFGAYAMASIYQHIVFIPSPLLLCLAFKSTLLCV